MNGMMRITKKMQQLKSSALPRRNQINLLIVKNNQIEEKISKKEKTGITETETNR